MRESRSYGSVRGALSDERPYRERRFNIAFRDNGGTDFLHASPSNVSAPVRGGDEMSRQ